MYNLLRFLPRNHLSRCVGGLAALPLPPVLRLALLKVFVRRLGIDLGEVAQPLEDFRCLADFFVRELKPGARPIGEGVVSPADGKLVAAAPIEDGCAFLVKNSSYRLETLLGDQNLAQRYRQGYALTIYLSPRDYHRVHSPVSGRILRCTHLKGTLWPVNDWSLQNIPNVFSLNERVATCIETEQGLVTLIMVGATNVGSVRMSFCDLRTNRWRWTGPHARVEEFSQPPQIQKAQELGRFHLGSTVLLLFEAGMYRPSALCVGEKLLFGQTIGRLEAE